MRCSTHDFTLVHDIRQGCRVWRGGLRKPCKSCMHKGDRNLPAKSLALAFILGQKSNTARLSVRVFARQLTGSHGAKRASGVCQPQEERVDEQRACRANQEDAVAMNLELSSESITRSCTRFPQILTPQGMQS